MFVLKMEIKFIFHVLLLLSGSVSHLYVLLTYNSSLFEWVYTWDVDGWSKMLSSWCTNVPFDEEKCSFLLFNHKWKRVYLHFYEVQTIFDIWMKEIVWKGVIPLWDAHGCTPEVVSLLYKNRHFEIFFVIRTAMLLPAYFW